jgi:uncharacterized membrane protein
MALLTPPMAGSDERDHFARAYQLARGDIVAHRRGNGYGSYLPEGYHDDVERMVFASYAEADRTAFLDDLGRDPPSGPPIFVDFGNTSAYGPGSYAAYVPAIVVGRAAGLSTLAILYLARLAGVIAYAGLLALAVRRMPYRPWVVVAVGTIPAALLYAATVCADGMALALSLLVIADALRLAVDVSAPRRQLLAELAASSLVLALGKAPYIAFVLLVAIAAWRFRDRLLVPLAAIAGGSIAIALAWAGYQSGHSIVQGDPSRWFMLDPHEYSFRNVDAAEQVRYLIGHPQAFVAAAARTIARQRVAFPHDLVGQLSLYRVPLLLAAVIGGAVVASAALPAPVANARPGRVERQALLALTTVIGVAILLIAYVTWNAVRAPRIDAVQPRYFLPLVAPLLIALWPVRFEFRDRRAIAVVLTGAVVALTIAAVGLARFSFGPPPLRGPLKDRLLRPPAAIAVAPPDSGRAAGL